MSFSDRHGLAADFVSGLRNTKTFYDAVRPTWSLDGARFIYSRKTRTGLEYVLVDTKTHTRKILDSQLLLNSLAQVSRSYNPTLEALSNLSITEDGLSITFEYESRRWRAALESVVLTDIGPAAGPGEVLAPDGSVRVILNSHNLMLLDNHGRLTVLTDDGRADCGYGDFNSFTSMISNRFGASATPPLVLWSPDSTRLATMQADLSRVATTHLLESVPRRGARPRLHTYRFPMPGDGEGARLKLVFINRSGDQVHAKIEALETFAFNPLGLGWGWWEDKGRHFLLMDASRDGNRVTLWRIDSLTGEAAVLVVEESPGIGRPRLDGGTPAVHRLGDGRTIWWSEANGSGQLYMVQSGAPESRAPITAGGGRVAALLHVDETNETILFSAQGREPALDPYYLQAYSIGFDGGALRRLTPEDLNHDLTPPSAAAMALHSMALRGYSSGARGLSPDGRLFVDSYSAVDHPPVSVLRDREGNLILKLEDAQIGDGWPANMPLPEPFQVRGLDGMTDLWGVLYRPPMFDPRRRYPLVEIIYGGPQTSVVPKAFRQTRTGSVAEQIAALGYITIILDGPGTAQRSRAFGFRSYGRIESCGGLDDHAAAIRQLAAERTWIDLSAGVGVMGMSGGGYATVRAMATFPDLYKVGVSICGNHDQAAYISQWGDVYHGLYEPALYASQANASVASKITGKLLLIHGEMDDNVHPAHTLKVVDALIAADVDFDMLLVPKAGHRVGDHPYVRRRAWDYFLTHLPPAIFRTSSDCPTSRPDPELELVNNDL